MLFLQNLQLSAGTGATALGVAIGLAAKLAVGVRDVQARAQAPLPQDADRDRRADRASARRLYASWEGIGAQLAALLVVYGSYALARGLQTRRYRRVAGQLAEPVRG